MTIVKIFVDKTDTDLYTYLAPDWILDWGPAGGSPCWTGQSARLWRMWPGGLDHCRLCLQRRELLALGHRKIHKGMLSTQLKQLLRKKKRYKIEVSTFVFVEYCEGGGGGVGVPQSHGPICRAGEEALVCAAVDQTPNWVSVSIQLSTQHWWFCQRQHKMNQVSEHSLISKSSDLNITHVINVTLNCYRRSRRGQCWDWGCSSTVWFRQPLRWNTAPLYCSSPHSAQPLCVSVNYQFIKI